MTPEELFEDIISECLAKLASVDASKFDYKVALRDLIADAQTALDAAEDDS